MSSVGVKRLTFDEWQALPETKQRCEVVDGVLTMPPDPLSDHQLIVSRLDRRLAAFVENQGLGVVFPVPMDVLILREPLRTRQPDIFYLNFARIGVGGTAHLTGLPFIEFPVDLVVEVLSPGNTRGQMEEKLADYRSIGVLECWLVKTQDLSVEVLALSPAAVDSVATFGMGDDLRSGILTGFSLPIADIFGPLLR